MHCIYCAALYFVMQCTVWTTTTMLYDLVCRTEAASIVAASPLAGVGTAVSIQQVTNCGQHITSRSTVHRMCWFGLDFIHSLHTYVVYNLPPL